MQTVQGFAFPPERFTRFRTVRSSRSHERAQKNRPSRGFRSNLRHLFEDFDRSRSGAPSVVFCRSERGLRTVSKKKVTRAASEEVRALDSGTRGSIKVGSRTVAFGHVMHLKRGICKGQTKIWPRARARGSVVSALSVEMMHGVGFMLHANELQCSVECVVETLKGLTKILQLGQSRGIDGRVARWGGKRRHWAVRADWGGGDADGAFQR